MPTCPYCQTALLNSDKGLFCRTCYKVIETVFEGQKPARKPVQPLKSAETYKNEAELVEAIREALEARGWQVWRIGQHVVKGSGSDAGVPDLLCVYPRHGYHPAIVRLIEAKHGYNKPTPEQQVLIDIGASVAVWSVEEALEAIEP